MQPKTSFCNCTIIENSFKDILNFILMLTAYPYIIKRVSANIKILENSLHFFMITYILLLGFSKTHNEYGENLYLEYMRSLFYKSVYVMLLS